MKLTNKTGLPEPIVNAIKNDGYSNGGADFSVTGLLRSGYMNHLYKEHADGLVEDASDRIFSLLGQAVHGILERSALILKSDESSIGKAVCITRMVVRNMLLRKPKDYIVEKRLFADIDGYKVSGQMDVIHNKTIQDYKITTVYKLNDTSDFEKQLNIYRLLCHLNGIEVDKLQANMIFRDWSKMKAIRDHNYPQTQVAIIDLPVWSLDETREFVSARIAEQVAKTPCTEKERWSRGGNYAVMKKGAKRAVKLFDDKESAEQFMPTHKDSSKLYIEYREPEYIRCQHYCAVSEFCEHYKR